MVQVLEAQMITDFDIDHMLFPDCYFDASEVFESLPRHSCETSNKTTKKTSFECRNYSSITFSSFVIFCDIYAVGAVFSSWREGQNLSGLRKKNSVPSFKMIERQTEFLTFLLALLFKFSTAWFAYYSTTRSTVVIIILYKHFERHDFCKSV